jgi:putative ABC transport system permease protein
MDSSNPLMRLLILLMDNLVITNICQRPMRTIISVAGVALGVALVMLFTGLARGMSNDLQHLSEGVRAEIIFTRPGSMQLMSSTANLSTKYVTELRAIQGVAEAVPVIVDVTPVNRGFGFEMVEGVEWEPFARMNGLHIIAGRPPEAADEYMIDETKARNDKIGIGSVVKLFGDKPYRVTGIYAPEAGLRTKMSLSALQKLLEAPGKCTYILVKCHNANEELEVAKRIDEELPGNKIQFTRDLYMSVEKSVPALNVFLRTLVALAGVVSAIVVMLTMYTTITERTREIGILKALGASRRYIIGVIEKEALLISLMGLTGGFAITLVAGLLIHRVYGLVFEYSWMWTFTSTTIALFAGVVGALYPAARAANLDAVSALSYD